MMRAIDAHIYEMIDQSSTHSSHAVVAHITASASIEVLKKPQPARMLHPLPRSEWLHRVGIGNLVAQKCQPSKEEYK